MTEGKVSGLTTSELTGYSAEINMTEFDFELVWGTQSESYPELQN